MQQHTPALPGKAGGPGRSLHPCWLDQSKDRDAPDRRVETLEPDEFVQPTGNYGPEARSHRLIPSCFRVDFALPPTDVPGMEHAASHNRAPGPPGANYRRVASMQQGPVRAVPGCLDPGGRFSDPVLVTHRSASRGLRFSAEAYGTIVLMPDADGSLLEGSEHCEIELRQIETRMLFVRTIGQSRRAHRHFAAANPIRQSTLHDNGACLWIPSGEDAC